MKKNSKFLRKKIVPSEKNINLKVIQVILSDFSNSKKYLDLMTYINHNLIRCVGCKNTHYMKY